MCMIMFSYSKNNSLISNINCFIKTLMFLIYIVCIFISKETSILILVFFLLIIFIASNISSKRFFKCLWFFKYFILFLLLIKLIFFNSFFSFFIFFVKTLMFFSIIIVYKLTTSSNEIDYVLEKILKPLNLLGLNNRIIVNKLKIKKNYCLYFFQYFYKFFKKNRNLQKSYLLASKRASEKNSEFASELELRGYYNNYNSKLFLRSSEYDYLFMCMQIFIFLAIMVKR